jgi:hypothetical protein
MKKTAGFETVDGYEVITAIQDATIDPAATTDAVAEHLGIPSDQAVLHADFEQLYEQHAVCFDNIPNAKLLSETEEADVAPKFTALQEHEALTLEGEIIPDYRGVEYHLKTAGVWGNVKIQDIGVPLPEGAVFPEDLTPEEKTEIAVQAEADRVAALSPEEKDREELNKIKQEIAARDYRALKAYKLGQLLDTLYPGETKWYQGKLDRIHELEETLGLE